MNLNPVKLISYHLYLFQLENYRIRRYLAFLLRHYPWRAPGHTRKNLVWTLKATYLCALALVLQAFFSYALAYSAQIFPGVTALAANFAGLALFIAFFFFFPFFLIAAMILYHPFDCFFKHRIIAKAQKKIRRFPNLMVVGITGSYGKTTMKEVLAAILSQKFRVLATPENINTPIGISRLILEKLAADAEILIAEMGAYERGDIRALCEIAQPDIVVLTGINEAHLERFGSIENTVAAKFEIIDATKPDGMIILNADDNRVMQEYQAHTGKRKTYFYSAENNPEARTGATETRFFEDGSGIGFELAAGGESIGYIKVPFLGEYITGVIGGATLIAKELGLSREEIRAGIATLSAIPHRLQAIQKANGILVIDDSYNGNPAGAHEAIKTLGRFTNRRKVYITPGLVETGTKTGAVHREIGRELAKTANLVVLIKNSVTPFIAKGLHDARFPEEYIMWFDTAPEAHKKIPEILKPGDVALFQNDWPENYL